MRYLATCTSSRYLIPLVLILIALGHEVQAQDATHRLLEQDPHGLVLTLTSVGVVFLALVLLVVVFVSIGRLVNHSTPEVATQASVGNERSQKQATSTPSSRTEEEEQVAAAMALSQWQGEREQEVVTVIGLALHTELNVKHDTESYVLTIRRKPTQWNARSLGLRSSI